MGRGIPDDVKAINAAIRAFLGSKDEKGRIIGKAYGVYAFYDYDGEPIYVGKSVEGLSSRIGRHLTNQRTDAVAMNVLDPFEVASIEVWPVRYPPLPDKKSPDRKTFESFLNAAEFTVFQKVLKESKLNAVLNEKDIAKADLVDLPQSYKQRIIPNEIFGPRSHPDIRIARRALTIARLAQVISERKVSLGLRRTLLTQARRLERLANQRFHEFKGAIPVEDAGEETGEHLGEQSEE